MRTSPSYLLSQAPPLAAAAARCLCHHPYQPITRSSVSSCSFIILFAGYVQLLWSGCTAFLRWILGSTAPKGSQSPNRRPTTPGYPLLVVVSKWQATKFPGVRSITKVKSLGAERGRRKRLLPGLTDSSATYETISRDVKST